MMGQKSKASQFVLRPSVPDSQRYRLAHRPHGDDTFRWRGFLDVSRFVSLGRDDGDRLDVWGRRRFVTEAEFRIVDPHMVQNCCEFASDRDTRARHSTMFGDLHAHARKAPFLAANEEPNAPLRRAPFAPVRRHIS